MRRVPVRCVLGLALAAAGCQHPVRPWIEDIERPLPTELSRLGIFARVEILQSAVGVLEYEPAWPLYADGAEKRRLLRLPEGEHRIDAETWTYPVGTVFAKTFTFADPEDKETPIETRLLFRRRTGWDYALYRWNDDRAEATLLEGNWGEVRITMAGAAKRKREYVLPSRLDCRTCHETTQQHTGTPVLGIGPHQIGPSLETAGVLSRTKSIEPVIGRNEAETAALGYFVGNCVSCHTGGPGPSASFSLYPRDAIAQTVDQPVEGDLDPGIRVVPGDPESSALFAAVVASRAADRAAIKPMPPIGVTRSDPGAERILRRWIEALD